MSRFLMFALASVLLLFFACEGGAEEDVGDDALTAEEMFDEMVRAAAALDSVQLDTQVAPEGSESYTMSEIVTREGLYLRQGGGLEGFEEVCAETGATIEPANICELDMGEMLFLGEAEVFYRDRITGDWVQADPTGHWTGTDDSDEIDVEATVSTDDWFTSEGTTDYAVAITGVEIGSRLGPDLAEALDIATEDAHFIAQALPFLSETLVSAERGPHVSVGDERRETLVLKFAGELQTPFADQMASFPPSGQDEALDEIRAQIEEQLKDSPARSETEVTLVLDQDYRVHSAKTVMRMFAAEGRQVHTQTLKTEYSGHNEAELPGPLPAR